MAAFFMEFRICLCFRSSSTIFTRPLSQRSAMSAWIFSMNALGGCTGSGSTCFLGGYVISCSFSRLICFSCRSCTVAAQSEFLNQGFSIVSLSDLSRGPSTGSRCGISGLTYLPYLSSCSFGREVCLALISSTFAAQGDSWYCLLSMARLTFLSMPIGCGAGVAIFWSSAWDMGLRSYSSMTNGRSSTFSWRAEIIDHLCCSSSVSSRFRATCRSFSSSTAAATSSSL
mmetsp:Transcript_70274/g.195592  ORF Transcript_70274/g.195592 Transcript_70274/m.195592 type:complete len:228 (-) Transcript_70274:787-1470(-)